MNYDPIHDTYVSQEQQTQPPPEQAQQPTQPLNSSPHVPTGLLSIHPQLHPVQPIVSMNNNINIVPSNGYTPYVAESTNESTDVPRVAAIVAEPTTHSSQAPSDESDDEEESNPKRKKRKVIATNKAKHLKKAEGEPFWRRDIQYDFMKAIFNDEHAVFTNNFAHSDLSGVNNDPKITFSQLYIRTLAESSKCSKILKERLLKDSDMAHAVAKVCLLVNAGRMNTTINFVPEMKSTLRTYHSIPSLQIDASGNQQQLQDTPRLKSILKAVVDDDTLATKDLDELIHSPPETKPNTNIINIIFLLANYPYKIPFFDGVGNCFMEFFLNANINPRNKAQRFLWLLYTYLETNFTEQELAHNPFCPALPRRILINNSLQIGEDADSSPFDVDPEYEVEYANKMQQTRTKYLDQELSQHQVEFNPNLEATTIKKKPVPRKAKKQSPTVEQVEEDPPQSFITQTQDYQPLQFPIKSLNKLFDNYYPDSEIVPNDSLTFNCHQDMTLGTRPYVQEVRTSSKASTASFNKKTSILGAWIYRYFKYKRSIGNKLLGMEWEDIRYDLINGIENYVYQQFGQSLFKVSEANVDDLEDGLREDLSYLPVHDFNNANEKSMFVLQLMSFCNSWFIQALNERETNTQVRVSIDLDNAEVSIN